MDALYRGPDTDYSECRRGSRKMQVDDHRKCRCVRVPWVVSNMKDQLVAIVSSPTSSVTATGSPHDGHEPPSPMRRI